jgi:acyl carrier protein|tara:strand:- start:215 stop:460 length:246 start_codon:yes stop_codon:yes gene_type:complete
MDKKEKIIKIILNILEENDLEPVNVDVFNEKARLIEDLGLDSFSLAQLTVEVESIYGIDVFEKTLIRTFGELLKELDVVLD